MARRQQYLKYGNVIELADMTWVGADEPDEQESLQQQLCPELKKLDELDKQEFALSALHKKRKVGDEEFDSLLSVIESKRDALTKKLEKKGYFDNDIEQDQLEAQEQAYHAPVLKEPRGPMSSGMRVTLTIVAIIAIVVVKVAVFGPGRL